MRPLDLSYINEIFISMNTPNEHTKDVKKVKFSMRFLYDSYNMYV
jgi:hypothetical protein